MVRREVSRWAAVAAALVGAALTGCTDDPRPSPPPEQVDTTPAPDAGSAPENESPSESQSPSETQSAPDSAAQERDTGVTRPRTAKEAARRLARSERVIVDPDSPARELVRAARQQQLVYRELGTRPRWDTAVLAGVPRSIRGVVRANVASRREFRSMHRILADTLPAWRIVAPAPAEELLRYYKRAERAFGIGWEYLAAINLVETGMGRIRGTSVAGAQGPMQFIPSTWARWGRGDINDPADAIMAAARYLAHNGGARPGRMDEALWRYNNHTAYVRGVTHVAEVMEQRPRAYYGYYHWDIYYLTSQGDVRLPVGYHRDRPVPVKKWLATHPQR